MPIYYVITEIESRPPAYYAVCKILKVFECRIEDIDRIGRSDEFQQFYASGRQIQPMIFYREPKNPLQEFSTN